MIEHYLTKNDCYKAGRTITPKGIVVHSTAVNQKNVEAFTKPWNAPGVSKCVHAFIGLWNGKLETVQTLPWTRRCWGCGKGNKGTYNDSYIQFEICEADGQEWFDAIYEQAAELCAFLVRKYNISVANVVCHSEAHTRGYASNHADVMHWFPKYGKNMHDFRRLVSDKLENKLFAPHDTLTRGQAVTFLYKMAGSPGVNGSMRFRDVKKNKYYYDAVLWAVSKGITYGTTATTFSPGAVCTRAAFITMLYRYAGSPAVREAHSFDDVTAHDYYFEAVRWAVDNGITMGTTKNTFSPVNPITRAQAVTLLYRYSGAPAVSAGSPFIDVSPVNYFYKPVLWAYEKGITAGV